MSYEISPITPDGLPVDPLAWAAHDLLTDATLRNTFEDFSHAADDAEASDAELWGPDSPRSWVLTELNTPNETGEVRDFRLDYCIGSHVVGTVVQLNDSVSAELHSSFGRGVGDIILENPEGEPLTIDDAIFLVIQANKIVDID